MDLRGRSQRIVLAMLALADGATVGVERLYDALWEDDWPAKPAANLQAYVSRLRSAVGRELIIRNGDGYRLDTALVTVDVTRAERLADDGRLTEALALWRGPALDGLGTSAVLDPERTRLTNWRDHLAERDLLSKVTDDPTATVVADLEAAFAERPDRDPLARALAEVAWGGGAPADALRILDAHRRALGEQSGLEPSPEVAELERRVLADERPAVTAGPHLRRAPELIGRTDDLESLDRLMDEAELVTVVGPGGVGKTSLVAEWADPRADVVAVELDRIVTDDEVVAAVVAALGLGAVPITLGSVVERLRATPAVLVLDNCEHVLAGVRALVERLAAERPPVRMLATSRQMLGAAHERVLPLRPLEPNEAAAVFLNRAAGVEPTFRPTPSEADAIARICDRLDHMPLAVELAASRTGALAVTDIERHLDHALDTLIDPAAPHERHQTLRAAVDWSYRLLPDAARRLLPALTVFRGGFPLDALDALGDFGGSVAALAPLVDGGLVVRRPGVGPTRYRLLEPTAQFAVDLLDDRAVAEAGRDRWVARLLVDLETDVGTLREEAAVGRLREDLDNIGAAANRSLAGDGVLAAEIAAVLGRYTAFYGTAPLHELVDRIADSPAIAAAPRAGGALASSAHNRWMRGDMAGAVDCAREALDRLPADSPDRWMALFALSGTAYWRGRIEEAITWHDVIIADEAAPDVAVIGALAESAFKGALIGRTDGDARMAEAKRKAEAGGSPSILAHVLTDEAALRLFSDPAGALPLLDEAEALAERCGARALLVMVATGRITALSFAGGHEAVCDALPPVLDDLRRHGAWTYLWVFLGAAAGALHALGDAAAAADLIVATATDPVTPVEGPYAELVEQRCEEVRAAVGDARWTAAKASVGGLDRGAKVDLALDLIGRRSS